METIIKLNKQTAGRDKIVRLLQYSSKFLWHYMQQLRLNSNSISKLKSLEYTFSNFRKLLRLGRFLDSLYASLSSTRYHDVTIRVTATLSKIAYSLFLLADHLIWLGRNGVLEVDHSKWLQTSNKYWLYSITLNLIRDFYEVLRISKSKDALLFSRGSKFDTINYFIREHKDVVVDCVKNSCDVMIPLTALGYTRLSPGAIGFLGIISSLAGLLTLIDPRAQLHTP